MLNSAVFKGDDQLIEFHILPTHTNWVWKDVFLLQGH